VRAYTVIGDSQAEYDASIYKIIDRKPNHWKQLYNTRSNVDAIFWRDLDMFRADGDANLNYGWLTESRAIQALAYERFESSIPDILNNFKYVFTHSYDLIDRHEKIKWVPANGTWICRPKVYEHKVNLISMITSGKAYCDGHRKRMALANELRGRVDLFGRGFSEIQFKEDGLATYMFSIAHENASYPGYFTEKILDCFATGTIPIYWGDPEIGRIFNTDGIIMLNETFKLDSLTPDLYYSKIEAVKENCQIVKDNFIMVEDYIYQNYFREPRDNLL
jgi:hypothetical protein